MIYYIAFVMHLHQSFDLFLVTTHQQLSTHPDRCCRLVCFSSLHTPFLTTIRSMNDYRFAKFDDYVFIFLSFSQRHSCCECEQKKKCNETAKNQFKIQGLKCGFRILRFIDIPSTV